MTLAKSGMAEVSCSSLYSYCARGSVLACAARNVGVVGGCVRRCRRLGRQLVEQAIERRDGEVLVKGVVDLDHRRLTAGGEAFRGLERKLAVAAGLASLAA